MATSNCMILLARHEEASNDYMNAVTAMDRQDALEELNDLEDQLWKAGCR